MALRSKYVDATYYIKILRIPKVEDLMYFSNEYLGRACVAGILKRISYEIYVSYVSK
jgi:hypothetical protein